MLGIRYFLLYLESDRLSVTYLTAMIYMFMFFYCTELLIFYRQRNLL